MRTQDDGCNSLVDRSKGVKSSTFLEREKSYFTRTNLNLIDVLECLKLKAKTKKLVHFASANHRVDNQLQKRLKRGDPSRMP